MTAFSGSYTDKEVFEINMSEKAFEKIDFNSFDQENIVMYLNTNHLSNRLPNSITRRCLYQKDIYEYNLIYGNYFFL